MAEPLEMMELVNRQVRSGELGPALADTIGALCQQLKAYGQQLEVSNKVALNSLFISLRQAACRDAGHLGASCRLRLMELIELRAMKWRPSLSHSAYYSQNFSAAAMRPPLREAESGHRMESQLPCSPPPPPADSRVSTIPSPLPLPTPLFVAGGSTAVDGSTPSFYLLPALGNLALLGPFLHPHLAIEESRRVQKKTVKAAPLREEMTIRNADSGKLMGVKGRRVALVEQISSTVISFQKVPEGATKTKQRTLTITANDEESIKRAKQLIEETIRRNASPVEEKGRVSFSEDAERVYGRDRLLALANPPITCPSLARISSIAPEILRTTINNLLIQ